jgi:hypothetical protein
MTVKGRMLSAGALALGASMAIVAAQEHSDPRVGLKPGLRNAGQAARNMELVASLPKPQGFYDPKQPAGEPTGPERPAGAEASPTASRASGLNFANSDMAFSGTLMFLGNFNGFNMFEVEDPRKPRLLASVVCPGGQGDVSVHGNLLFMSVEQTRGRLDCGAQGVEATVSAERFRGIRIFDITDLKKPKQIAAVQTCRGSHTHTLVVDPDDKENVYIYGSGTSTVRSGDELAGCSNAAPAEDPNTSLFSIDVIQVPLAAPQDARIVNRPRIFADPQTGAIAGLARESKAEPGVQAIRETNQCHDITVFPQVGLAAGACAGNGILLDISDPVHPVRLDAAADTNFAYWHSATFNNDGTKVIFTDEWGGGTRPRCRATDPKNWGADAVFDIVDRKLRFRSYFKMPAAQTEQENCVAHNGSLIPVPGRDIMAQGWYQGGVSVFDFTDSSHPVEIAFFDRGPIDADHLFTGGFWSAYWYNGYVYGSEIARGVDVFRLTPSEFLTRNEIEAAALVRLTEFNPQNQSRMTWPSSLVVARAYLDQLNRDKAINPEHASALKSAIDNADRRNPSKGALENLSTVATELESDRASAQGHDVGTIAALVEVLKDKGKR